jgi:hypothetical protein
MRGMKRLWTIRGVRDVSRSFRWYQALEEPHVNPNTRTMELALRDPDGYYVMISAA